MKNFFRALLTELKCRIFSLGFIIPVIFAALSYITSIIEDLKFMWNNNLDVLYFWDMSQNIGYFTSISILCCTALNCTSFLNDYRSDYYRNAVLRSGKLNYTLSKYLSCVFCGGLTLCIGLELFIFVLMLRFPLVSDDSSYRELYIYSADKIFTGELLESGHNVGFFAIYAFLAFLFGALWSAVGICVSSFITDKYVASFSPYVIWYTSRGLLSGMFKTENIFNGNYNVGGVAGSVLFAVLYFGIVITVLGFIFCIKAGRRCEN